MVQCSAALLILILPVINFYLHLFFTELSDDQERKELKKTSVISFMGVLVVLLCLICPVSAVGVFRNATGYWNLDYNNTGVVDVSFQFGKAGDVPVTGDWYGERISDAGVFRPSTGIWYLDTTRAGVVNKSFQFGKAGDVPVTGDWNGDGISDAGVFRPSTGIWYLDTSKTGVVNKSFQFGKLGDLPEVMQLPVVYIVAPFSAFTSDIQTGNAPLTVMFTNQSTGTEPLTYAWDFDNNGTVDNTDPSCNFTYTVPGTYTVTLTVTNRAGSDIEQKTGYITVNPAPVAPEPEFTVDDQSGYAPLEVEFTDQSTGTAPLSYAWDFNNDDTNDNFQKNPTHTYDNPGTYSVKLTVTNIAGTNSVTKSDYITVNEVPVAPEAAFTAAHLSGSAPLWVRFTDESTGSGPMTYAWDFDNDGDDNTLQNPFFKYDTPGVYNVTLTVTNELGSDHITKTGYITVTEGQPGPHAGVAITFDDNSIEKWYDIRIMLNNYYAHVTFFVSEFGHLDLYGDEVTYLRDLKADGHEIAFHGSEHRDAVDYLQNHSINDYLNNEILNGVQLMTDAGLAPVDFSYPYGSDNETLTEELQAYFTHIRDTTDAESDSIFYEYGSDQPLIYGAGIDDITYGYSMEEINESIARAKEEEKILIFYCHEPVIDNPGSYQISYDRLEKILANVTESNLEFFRIEDIY